MEDRNRVDSIQQPPESFSATFDNSQITAMTKQSKKKGLESYPMPERLLKLASEENVRIRGLKRSPKETEEKLLSSETGFVHHYSGQARKYKGLA